MREWLKAMHGEDYDYRKMVRGGCSWERSIWGWGFWRFW